MSIVKLGAILWAAAILMWALVYQFGDLPMTETSVANLWRDVKTYKHYALIVADNVGVHGMQIFDLTQLRDVENLQGFQIVVIKYL